MNKMSKIRTAYLIFLDDRNGGRSFIDFYDTPKEACIACEKQGWEMRFYALLQRSGLNVSPRAAEKIRRFENKFVSVDEAIYKEDSVGNETRIHQERFKDLDPFYNFSWADAQRQIDSLVQCDRPVRGDADTR